jgi:hypothetical protein
MKIDLSPEERRVLLRLYEIWDERRHLHAI